MLNDKKPETIVKALHRGWCLYYRYPTIGFWSDNGGEFIKSKMEEFVSKLGFKINSCWHIHLGLMASMRETITIVM